MFLNRPLIKVLEDLQVPEEAFMAMLTDAISHAQQLKQYTRETRRQLTLHGLGMSFGVTELVEAIANLLRTNKLEPFKEGGSLSTFIANSLEYAEVHILRLLKHKARIPVPNAHVGVAIADESGTLKEVGRTLRLLSYIWMLGGSGPPGIRTLICSLMHLPRRARSTPFDTIRVRIPRWWKAQFCSCEHRQWTSETFRWPEPSAHLLQAPNGSSGSPTRSSSLRRVLNRCSTISRAATWTATSSA